MEEGDWPQNSHEGRFVGDGVVQLCISSNCSLRVYELEKKRKLYVNYTSVNLSPEKDINVQKR